MKPTVLALVAALAVATGATAETQQKDVDIKAPDGVVLKGTYYSPGRPGPAMLLLHQCNMDRHAWDSLAKDLADAGVHVLTIDFRGFGDSGGERLAFSELVRAVIPQKFPGDVDAAYAFLLAQKDVDKGHVAAGGASCGVTQAAGLASRRDEIKTLMLLSGTAGDAGLAHIRETPAVAVFGAASADDKAAAAGIKAAVEASKNPKSTLKIYDGTEHGVPMFAKHPELEPMIVQWVTGQLAIKGTTE
ncbi:MAG TPA: alpha/beta fold hydrolase [Gammaproteobacteria bacterium]|nr:alpha/beta fold hydrolase [Gammaproteobacteria bacterium]